LVPHFETSTAPPLVLVLAAAVLLLAAAEVLLLGAAALDELLLLLLPHPARTARTTTATSARLMRTRTRAELSDILTPLLSLMKVLNRPSFQRRWPILVRPVFACKNVVTKPQTMPT
jgi:hypothetical protein